MISTRRCAALLSLLANAIAFAQTQPTAPAAEDPRFDILEFVVTGDTVLGNDAIERAVYPFMGPQRSAADAEAARKALEKAYQDAGFLSVSVVLPPQRVGAEGGEVRIQVVEAAIERLRVTGARYTLPSQVREAVPAVAVGSVPNFNEMQQQLSQLARTSVDREVTPIIAAGEKPATMDVEMKVQDSAPVHASIEANNKQSQNTQAGRIEAAASYDNLFQRGHSLAFNWFYSPKRPVEANIQSLTYSLPAPWIGGPGDTLSLNLLNSDSNTPTPLGGATVSRGQTWRLRWRDELGSRDGLTHAVTWGFTLRHLRDANRDVAGFSTDTSPLRYQTFNASYELNLSGAMLGNVPDRSARLQADVTLSPSGLNKHSVDCFGTTMDQFACKRANARSGFTVLNLGFTWREPFGRWLLSTRLLGQYADGPLVPAEQVVYGGQDSVRGYYEGEQAGDIGSALRLELTAPPWQPMERVVLRGSGFYDAAVLRRLNALPYEVATTHLASVGLGLRLDTSFGLQASIYWAHLLDDTTRLDSSGLQEPLSGSRNGRGQRVDFNLRQSF